MMSMGSLRHAVLYIFCTKPGENNASIFLLTKLVLDASHQFLHVNGTRISLTTGRAGGGGGEEGHFSQI